MDFIITNARHLVQINPNWVSRMFSKYCWCFAFVNAVQYIDEEWQMSFFINFSLATSSIEANMHCMMCDAYGKCRTVFSLPERMTQKKKLRRCLDVPTGI